MSTGGPREPDEIITRLAFALQLVDTYTDRPLPARQLSAVAARSRRERLLARQGKSIAGRSERERRDSRRGTTSDVPTISIRNVEADPIVNPSGYLLYFREDFPEQPDEIEIEVEGGERYVDERVTVELAEHDPQKPVEVELKPVPAYRFPAGTTLVRGYVFVVDEELDDGDDIDLMEFGEEGVKLEVGAFEATTRTVRDGEYALPITGITADDAGDGLVRVNGGDPSIQIELQHDDFEDASIQVEISEGETQCYQIKFDINEDEDVMYRKCGTVSWKRPST